MVYKSRKETAKAEIEIGSKGWVCGCVCTHTHIFCGWSWQVIQVIEK